MADESDSYDDAPDDPFQPDEDAELAQPPEKEMSVLDHLEDMRFVLLKSISAFIFFCILVLFFSVKFADVLNWPYRQAHEMVGMADSIVDLRSRGPLTVFSVIVQLAFFGGLGLSLPWVIYFISGFIAPGLTDREKRILKPACVSILILFLLGTSFSYFILLPTSLAVSLKLNALYGFQPLWDPSLYFGMIVWMTLGLGVIAQFPLILILLVYLRIIRLQMLREHRRHALVFMAVFGAVLTPGGDPLTLGLMVIPLYGLYEMAIAVGGRLMSDSKKESLIPKQLWWSFAGCLLMGCLVYGFLFFKSASSGKLSSSSFVQAQEYWGQGEELTRYILTQSRLNEVEEGVAEITYGLKVKKDRTAVLQTALDRRFDNGSYGYQNFVSLQNTLEDGETPRATTIKTTSKTWNQQTAQNWTRQIEGWSMSQAPITASALENREYIQNAWHEDEIWALMRLNPKALPLGTISLIPNSLYLQLSNLSAKAYQAKGSIQSKEGQSIYTIDYSDLGRRVTYHFDSTFPHLLRSWKEEQEGSSVVVEAILSSRTEHFDYWAKEKGSTVK